MSKLLPILAGAGAGTIAYLLFFREAGAVENDETGVDVPPESPESRPAPPLIPGRPSLGERAVEVLMRYWGAAEQPLGSNRSPVIDKIVLGVHGDGKAFLGKPWCARAAKFAFEQAAVELGLPPPFQGKGDLGSGVKWQKALKGFETSAPRPGTVAIKWTDKKNGKSHTVIVSRVEGQKVTSIEGNHGHMVATVNRKLSDYDLFLDAEAFVQARAPRLVA